LLDEYPIRVGNEEYARANQSYGLTTLGTNHVELQGDRIRLSFVGKSGKEHRVELSDARLGRAIRACEELPGQSLFRCETPEGAVRRIHSEDVNAYIREASGGDFTAKDFRTWSASVMAAGLLAEAPEEDLARPVATERRVVREVASWLGNTVSVCRQCYIHPAVLEGFHSGSLGELWEQGRTRWRASPRDEYELMFLALLARGATSCKPSARAKRRTSHGPREAVA
jgi:DNA topoisomerase-1